MTLNSLLLLAARIDGNATLHPRNEREIGPEEFAPRVSEHVDTDHPSQP